MCRAVLAVGERLEIGEQCDGGVILGWVRV
jgi:hypothetical protein